MKTVAIDIDEIAFVMEIHDSLDSANILDTETGEILSIYRGLLFDFKNGNGHSTRDLPPWESKVIDKVERVYLSGNGRYKEIPNHKLDEAHAMMAEFSRSVEDGTLKEQLEAALEDRHAFRKFFKILTGHPKEHGRWFVFSEERLRRKVVDWLGSIGIEPLANPQ